MDQRKKTIANQPLENMLNGMNSHSQLTAFERMEQKLLDVEKSSNKNPAISFFTESDDRSSEDILKKAIQETEELIKKGILSQEYLKKQLIEQETTLKTLQQHLSTLNQLRDKLDNKVSNKSTFSKEGQAYSKHLEGEKSDFDNELISLKVSNVDGFISSSSPNYGINHLSSSTPVDDELEQLRQELKKK